MINSGTRSFILGNGASNSYGADLTLDNQGSATLAVAWNTNSETSTVANDLIIVSSGISGSPRVYVGNNANSNVAVTNDVDIEIKESDLRIDVFRAGGPGGQSVNTTDSAVRITHIPSGVVVSQQDEKSQHKNKAKALKILRSRVYEAEKRKKDQERSSNRRSQIGSGDRSERIRTYNFPQGRVTDHRINLTLHKLDEFLSGDIHEEMNQELRLKEQNLKLENLNS